MNFVKFDYFVENPCDFACDNCPKSYNCEMAYTYGEDYTPCLIQRVAINIKKDILEEEDK